MSGRFRGLKSGVPPRPQPCRTNGAQPTVLRSNRAVRPHHAPRTEGAASPGANLRVDEPFAGYDKLRAPEVVERVRAADAATKAVVRLYESTHKKRKSVLAATGG